ncbi:AAA family ATPase [Clostridium sp. YIM B02505]|uniref:AAA family ATPase n=1 Tax=Clostridium yunnanense TaxID=2800325 RepID=A0ABS1EJI5_9CLOT|nr:AAA family ATPase [Clostridium yunnanense]MBK1809528.1 AAA family ATPase [Clostridium yunnanense]
MDNNIVNKRKKRPDSWVDINSDDKSFLGRKRVDYSTFDKGTTIPERYHKVFLDNLSEDVTKGKQVKIKLRFKDKEYNASIRWPNSKGRKGVTIQIIYSNKALKDLLQDKLRVSYDYIMNYLKDTGKKPVNIPDEYAEYIDFFKGDKPNNFIIKLINKDNSAIEDEEPEDDLDEELESEDEFASITDVNSEISFIHNYISSKGFYYSKDLITNLYLSLKTKPFAILSGISGTGKSKIIELFAEAVGANRENGRFRLVSVRPDWSDATDLLGYRNIENKFVPGIIIDIANKAMKNPDNPYFLCLDEMNLARVEYYFSDILSAMETRKISDEGIITQKLINRSQFGRDEAAYNDYGDVHIPENLYIVGTVNMDETTFSFSKKVLDRANTIEFNKVNLMYSFEDTELQELSAKKFHNDFLKSEYLNLSQCKDEKDIALKVIDKLIEINNILEKYQQHFAYRVRDEIVFYVIYAVSDDLFSFEKAMDFSIVQKILPKIGGSGGEVLDILIKLFNNLNDSDYESEGYLDDTQIKAMEKQCESSKYKLSSEKIIFMIRRFQRDGFTTFW